MNERKRASNHIALWQRCENYITFYLCGSFWQYTFTYFQPSEMLGRDYINVCLSEITFWILNRLIPNLVVIVGEGNKSKVEFQKRPSLVRNAKKEILKKKIPVHHYGRYCQVVAQNLSNCSILSASFLSPSHMIRIVCV